MQVALLETSVDAPPLAWPWVSRGVEEQGLERVTAWQLNTAAAAAAATTTGGGSSSSSGDVDAFARAVAAITSGYGSPAVGPFEGTGSQTGTQSSISRSDPGGPSTPSSSGGPTAPRFQELTIPGVPGASFVGACCRNVSWPTPRRALASPLIVLRSNLQAALVAAGGDGSGSRGNVLAWVTSATGQPKPVPGARVQTYASTYGQV